MKGALQVFFAGIGGWLGYVMGGYDGFFYALVAFTTIDYLTGLMCAVLDKKLSSLLGFRGIFKKILIFVMVSIGNIIDKQLIGNGEVLRNAVIFFYVSNEGISILENSIKIGLPVPQKLRDVLQQLNKGGGKYDNK